MSDRTGIYVRVSTDDQRDNGYSIDSQLRMLKEHCEKNGFDIVDVYNDAGHSGKDLMRPEMQRLLKDIKSQKIDRLIAIKVDRLTRNGYDGFWLLNYCEEHDVKIELILEPYDVGTANGEMIFGMNLVFGQRERKEIGARTKRAMEQMALSKIHPGKAPYGYTRNNDTGHLEVDPIEAVIVKEVFELYSQGKSTRDIAVYMKDNNRYLKRGIWHTNRIYNILVNPIYIGTYGFGLFTRKQENILYVDDYCEPIIDMNLWNRSRTVLEKNKNPNYGTHIHLFTSLIKCPDCNKTLSSTLSYKNSGKPNKRKYYHLTCKNHNCKSKGLHYSSDKIEKKLTRLLNELTRFMFDSDNEIITSSSKKSQEVKDIDKAINKLRIQEKRLVDLYVDSNLSVETINHKSEQIRKEILKLNKKKESMFPEDDNKEYTVELLKKLDHRQEDETIIFPNNFAFSYLWDSLSRKSKKEMINRLVSSIEITRDDKYNIDIKDIRFSDEFVSKSTNEYLCYLNAMMNDNQIGIIYKEPTNKRQKEELSVNNYIISLDKFVKQEYPNSEQELYMQLIDEYFWTTGVINCPYVEDETIVDILLLIPRKETREHENQIQNSQWLPTTRT